MVKIFIHPAFNGEQFNVVVNRPEWKYPRSESFEKLAEAKDYAVKYAAQLISYDIAFQFTCGV